LSQRWSPGQFTDRGLGFYNFDLHPDGKRFAVLKAQSTEQAAAVNKVSFIFNPTSPEPRFPRS
jgi:hypothetical protein